MFLLCSTAGVGETGDSGRRRLIDGAAKARFVAALRTGTSRSDAAAAEGFTHEAFYRARYRDPLFHAAWVWALELSAIEERQGRLAGHAAIDAEADEIAPNNGRSLQRRRRRGVRFTEKRKRIFLDSFAGTADVRAASRMAGVGLSTIYGHRRTDPEFARGWDEALAHAYAELEAEALRQRLEAQRNLRDGLVPTGEMPKEFDRVLRLLARYERRDGRIGLRERGPGREARWSFDDAIALLDRKLRALGARHDVAPPEDKPLLPSPEEDRK